MSAYFLLWPLLYEVVVTTIHVAKSNRDCLV